MRPRFAGAVAGALLAMAILAGCSQEQALAPVAGDDITQLRIAVNDALAEATVPVLVSPVCREDGEVTRCTGTTRASRRRCGGTCGRSSQHVKRWRMPLN